MRYMMPSASKYSTFFSFSSSSMTEPTGFAGSAWMRVSNRSVNRISSSSLASSSVHWPGWGVDYSRCRCSRCRLRMSVSFLMFIGVIISLAV